MVVEVVEEDVVDEEELDVCFTSENVTEVFSLIGVTFSMVR